MGAFIVRRLLGMIAVMFVVSFLVFVIFIKIPGGDPASRMAGKNPLPQNITNIRKQWGFDKPFYVQYVRMMQKTANGLVPGSTASTTSCARSTRARTSRTRSSAGFPRRCRSASAPAIIWLFFGTLVGRDLGGLRREVL
jgi:ABC-type dipeptide/oligopeptide/nickel transport system permease component